MKIGMVVNRIETEWPGYTTTHLALAANNMGHEVWYTGVSDLVYGPDEHVYAHARMAPPKPHRAARVYLDSVRGRDAVVERISLAELDVVLLRNDPAEDLNRRPWARLAGINFGRLALRHSVIVLNDPDGLMHAVNKTYLEYFPQEVRPRSLVSRDRKDIKDFVEAEGGRAVLKPLSGSGGRNVFLVTPEEPNVNQMIEAVSSDGYVIAQQYLPDAVHGDTRLFLLNAVPLKMDGKYAAMRRVRGPGDEDIRSNMTAGATSAKAQVDERMLELAELVRPRLIEDGMFFVGLDIAGGKLMEINVFSPGGLMSADEFEHVNFHREVIRALERKVEYVAQYGRKFDNREIATL